MSIRNWTIIGELEIVKAMSEYANKSKEELQKTVTDNHAKLQAFRFAMAGSKTKNVKEGKAIRKEIARMLTEINRK